MYQELVTVVFSYLDFISDFSFIYQISLRLQDILTLQSIVNTSLLEKEYTFTNNIFIAAVMFLIIPGAVNCFSIVLADKEGGNKISFVSLPFTLSLQLSSYLLISVQNRFNGSGIILYFKLAMWPLVLMYCICAVLISVVLPILGSGLSSVLVLLAISNSEVAYHVYGISKKSYAPITLVGLVSEDLPQLVIQISYAVIANRTYELPVSSNQIFSFVFTGWNLGFTVLKKIIIDWYRDGPDSLLSKLPESFDFELVPPVKSAPVHP